jgi:exopolysaccharide biosynthesis polyprenyl glycosylphosphotransferase
LENSRYRALRKIIYILDISIVVLSLILAFLIQTNLRSISPIFKETPHFSEYALVAFLTLPLWLFLVSIFRLQQIFEKMWTVAEIAVQLIKLHLTALVVLSIILFLSQTVVNRSLVSLFLICTFVLMLTERAILGLRMRYAWRHGYEQPRIILVGAPSDAMASFVDRASSEPLKPLLVGRVSIYDQELDSKLAAPSLPPMLGETGDLEHILHDVPTDEVLLFSPLNTPVKAERLLKICDTLGIPARLAVDLTHPGSIKPTVISIFEHPFIAFESTPKNHGLIAVKHGFDALAALIGLIVLMPLFLVVCSAVLLTMGRPVFFVQVRAGLYGRTFRMIKFRTMIKDAELKRNELLDKNEMSGPVFKVTDDPRTTSLGRFLRRWSIDELPQLINVLGGTMSLVGPRPLPIGEQEGIFGWHRRRLSMKPGITGLWQVSGRSDVNFETWMKLDLKYIDEWSLGLDLLTLLKTVRAVVTKAGAK